jgi:type II secretory pathway component GspD/PulD (secretin)
LWVGLLQTVAQAVWWCHPLVWWVSRRTTREAERCCDEEVLAELGCDPAAYARALVDVLELKRELKPVPVFPGVRPVEVTSQRLERIMQLGQGCQRRTPWWCWLLAALAAAATWPGAAFVVTAEDVNVTTKTAPGERGGVSPPVISPQPPNRGADAAPLADAWNRAIVRGIGPRQGLSYRVRVISGAEDDVRALARTCDEKLLAASSAPVVVANDELQRLLKAAQAAPRVNLVSHPIATSRGGESAIVADTKNFSVPVEVTQRDETVQFFETVRQHGWKLTLQPVTFGESSLRLRVVNWQGRLNDDDAVKVRYRTTGEEKLIPGLNERQTSATVELRDDQQLVFPVSSVPESSDKTFMLLTLQVSHVDLGDAIRLPEPVASAGPATPILRGVGVNSNSGITGQIVDEKVGEVSAVDRPAPLAVVPPAKMSERQILLQFHIYEVDEGGLKELGIKLGRAKATQDGLKSRSVSQVQVDRDVIAKLTAMERGQRIKVLSSPSITTLDGHVASFLNGGEFAVPTIVGVGEAKGTATTFRGFGLHLTAKPTIVGPDSLRLSLTMSDSKVADDPNGGATTVAPTLISQSIQSELLLKSKQSVFFGPLGEPGAKGKQLIATLEAEIVEPNPATPVSGEVLPSPAAPRLAERGDRATKYSVDRPAGGHITLLKSQPVSAVAGEEKLVSCQFENVPLKAAIKQLAESTGRNIVLEKAGLEDESLTERAPVTIALDDVKLNAALKLMLDPLNLGYRVEESGVIVVTSQQRLKGQAIIVTYSVADLAVPVPKRVSVKLTADRGETFNRDASGVRAHAAGVEVKPAKSIQPQLPELVKLITSTCQPKSWEAVGGNGSIKVNDATLSLVVRQTQDVHDEIRDLLEQLRRLQDIQASLHVETLTVPADFWHKVGKDFDLVEADGQPNPQPQDKGVPRTALEGIGERGGVSPPVGTISANKNRGADATPLAGASIVSQPQRVARLTRKEAALLRSLVRPESAPKVTLFNGQELEVFFGGESPTMRLGLKPVVSADHKGLRLHATATKPDAELDFAKLAAVPLESGHSLLLDVTEVYSVGPQAGVPILDKVPGEARLFKNTGKSDQRTLLLITGQVVIVEEEEVRKTSRGQP